MIKDRKSYQILVVEDNEGDLLIVEDLLMETIFLPVIVQATSFKAAKEILTSQQSGFDVILLDIKLPDKGGKDLVKEILLLAPSIPVIVLTGYTDMGFSISSISQGVIDYLLKEEMNATSLYKSIIYSIERKRSFMAVKESEQRYIDLFNLSPQPMWVFECETFKIVQANKAMIELYGYSEAELLSMTIMDIKMQEDIPEFIELIKNRKSDSPLLRLQACHRKKSGEIVDMEIYSRNIILNNEYCRSVVAIDVTEKNQQDRRIIKAIIKTQEDERYEIGGELHDNVCQLLAVSQLSLGMLKPSLAEDAIPLFDQCKDNIGMALTEIRNLSHRLAPVFFNDISLEVAFRKLIDSFKIDNKYCVAIYVDPSLGEYVINPDIQLNLYRIMQEQLRNIVKYSQGTEIELDVVIYQHMIRMKIADNGVGFNPQTVKSGIGLANMKRRAELFSGNFELSTSLGNGCTIIIGIPIQSNLEILTDQKLELA